jgi:hypothetical protein
LSTSEFPIAIKVNDIWGALAIGFVVQFLGYSWFRKHFLSPAPAPAPVPAPVAVVPRQVGPGEGSPSSAGAARGASGGILGAEHNLPPTVTLEK